MIMQKKNFSIYGLSLNASSSKNICNHFTRAYKYAFVCYCSHLQAVTRILGLLCKCNAIQCECRQKVFCILCTIFTCIKGTKNMVLKQFIIVFRYLSQEYQNFI